MTKLQESNKTREKRNNTLIQKAFIYGLSDLLKAFDYIDSHLRTRHKPKFIRVRSIVFI